MEAATVETVMAQGYSFFQNIVSFFSDILSVVASNPILFIMVVGIPLAGFSVGLLRRLISL